MSTEPAGLRPPPLGLFEGYGVEIEYMLVRGDDLSVAPLTDALLARVAGEGASDYEEGPIGWSNELALHVVELKTNGPAGRLEVLPALFQRAVGRVHEALAPLGARLMPGGMHPWMDPHAELKLWPHDHGPVYRTFDRIFDCTGHGWANLQSTHLNLPFRNDAEFARLHAAIRLVLPILPALAASSPVRDGELTGLLDNRLDVYRRNARRLPTVSGRVIPEGVFDEQSYRERILEPMYAEIAPHDPEGVLRHEWLNARGAIARFERQTIEIRVLDTQECPLADLAICAAVVEVLRALVDEHWTPLREQRAFEVEALEPIFLDCVHRADEAVLTDRDYLRQFGYPVGGAATEARVSAHDLWKWTLESLGLFRRGLEAAWGEPLRLILEHGPLARRLVRAFGGDTSRPTLKRVYGALSDCLREGRLFVHETGADRPV